jgi:uncharacterized protein involved in exopolysaccharide biosynthesis
MQPMKADDSIYEVQMNAIFYHTLRRWPMLLIIALLGALLGLASSAVQKPRYEAKAMMGVSIQYGVIEELELVVEDRALNRVALVILADSTLSQVFSGIPQDLRQKLGWQETGDLRQILRLDRGLSDWGFVAVHQDPELAAMVSSLWMETSLTILQKAQDHAWQAVALMGDEPFQLLCDQEQLSADPVDTNEWQCELEPVSLSEEALAGQLRTEIELSRGILPVFSFEALHTAEIPQKSVMYHRGILVLSGAFLGFFIGIGIVLLLPRRSSE